MIPLTTGGVVMSAQKWWQLVEDNWENLLAICEQYLPMSDCQNHEGTPSRHTVREHILYAKEHRHSLLSSFLTEAWWRIPDSPEGKSLPGWGVLNKLIEDEPW